MSEPIDILKSVKATLNGRDLLPMTKRIIVVEDMNNAFPRSMIEMIDSGYVIQEALADNPLDISIQPQNGPALDVKHKVHSAKPEIRTNGRGLQGVITGVDDDFSKFLGRFTGAWKQKNTDDVIKQIYKEVGGSKKIEVTRGFKQASFTSPSLMPMKAIKKCGDLSGCESKGFFFNTHRDGGTANFKTMKDMAKQGPKRNFVYKSTGAADSSSLGDPSIIFDLQYQGSPITTQKQTKAQGQRYNPQFGKVVNNSKAGEGLSAPGLGVKAADAKVGFPTINSIEQEKEKRHEDRDKQNLNEYTAKLKILVPIATDLHVGDVINVKSGSATMFSDASPENAASGKWLIVSLMHTIETGGNENAPGHTGRTLIHCVGKL